jgi:hypothetical protein
MVSYPAVPVKIHFRVSAEKEMALLAKQEPPDELDLLLFTISPLTSSVPASVKKGEYADLEERKQIEPIH